MVVAARGFGGVEVAPEGGQLFELAARKATAASTAHDSRDGPEGIGAAALAFLIRSGGVVVGDPLPDVAGHIEGATGGETLGSLASSGGRGPRHSGAAATTGVVDSCGAASVWPTAAMCRSR